MRLLDPCMVGLQRTPLQHTEHTLQISYGWLWWRSRPVIAGLRGSMDAAAAEAAN